MEGKPGEWAIRLSIAHGFAACLQRLDPAAEVPPADLLPRTRRRASPYLYTEAEIAQIVEDEGRLRYHRRGSASHLNGRTRLDARAPVTRSW